MNKVIVMGANGFLGSHVTQELVKNGRDVRVMIRKNADTRGIDGLNVERIHGDVLDVESLKTALHGCDTVFYCVVDTRAWLRDPAPLFRVNVDGLRNVLDAALESGVRKFIFTSSIGTIGKSDSGKATEADTFNWHKYAPDYIISRLDAENLLLEYCKRYGLNGCVMCVANTLSLIHI
jgi:dihydroflavonol-4-reductase